MIVFKEEQKVESRVCNSSQVILVMLATKWSISNATMATTFQMRMDWSKRSTCESNFEKSRKTENTLTKIGTFNAKTHSTSAL